MKSHSSKKKKLRYIKIPPDFFSDFHFEIKLPTIICKICGEEILATPENILLYGL